MVECYRHGPSFDSTLHAIAERTADGFVTYCGREFAGNPDTLDYDTPRVGPDGFCAVCDRAVEHTGDEE